MSLERGIYINDEYLSEDQLIYEIKTFFRENIALNHIKNTEKLNSLKMFKTNPFLHKYLANFLTGNTSYESIARAMVYPRVLGTSITTSFGSQMQKFVREVLASKGSIASGMDIEYIDHIDERKKYCQIKSGPQTINKDDVKTIVDAFNSVIRLGRVNGLPIASIDCVVGVLYGDFDDLSTFYKKIHADFPVYAGHEFWYRLTGSKLFYDQLTDSIAEIATDFDGSDLIEEVIDNLSFQLKGEEGF